MAQLVDHRVTHKIRGKEKQLSIEREGFLAEQLAQRVRWFFTNMSRNCRRCLSARFRASGNRLSRTRSTINLQSDPASSDHGAVMLKTNRRPEKRLSAAVGSSISELFREPEPRQAPVRQSLFQVADAHRVSRSRRYLISTASSRSVCDRTCS